MTRLFLVRLAPVLMLVIAAAAWFNDVQEGGPWVFRNLLPPLVLVALSALTLRRGNGTWTGSGWTPSTFCSTTRRRTCSTNCRREKRPI